VTGATGCIGANLARALQKTAQGAMSIRVLARASSNLLPLKDLDIEVFEGDICDYASVRRAMEGVDRVFHVAGFVNLGPFETKKLFAVNVGGTVNICRAAIDAGVKRIVHTSTVSTIGLGSKDRPADEFTWMDSGKLKVPYFMSKMQAEKSALELCSASKTDVVIVNPSFTLGPWDVGPSSGEIILWAVKSGGLPFYARGSLNAVAVEDVVAGHISAMEKGRSGERYILGNENLSHRQLLMMISEELSLRRPKIPLRYIYSMPFTWPGDLLGPYFPQKFRSWNSHMLRVMELSQYVSSAKAIRELDLPQTPVRLAIRSAYDWFKAVKRL